MLFSLGVESADAVFGNRYGFLLSLGLPAAAVFDRH